MKQLFTPVFIILFIFRISGQNQLTPTMKDWHYPYEVFNTIVCDSLEIAYVDEGKGKCTLLFLHGLGSNLKAWQKNIDFFKNDYRCIALDLPGYGKSGKGDYQFDMSFYAAAVQAFISKLNLKKVVLVGHSMGGQVAMHTVLNGTKKIEKLILVAPAGFETFTEKERDWFKAIITPSVLKSTPEEQIVKQFEMNFHDMPADADFMIIDRLLMRKTAEYDRYCEMIPKCVMGMLSEPVAYRLSEINVPTLVIFGENDLLIPNQFLHPTITVSEVAQKGSDRIPECDLKMISLAGHFVQWEKAEEVNELVLQFLK